MLQYVESNKKTRDHESRRNPYARDEIDSTLR